MGSSLACQRDYEFKYKATGRWHQLDCALVGTCIAPSSLSGSAKSRSGNNNLRGIIADGNSMYTYCRDNGAKVSLYKFAIPQPPASEVRRDVENFCKNGSNNKLLYMTGHGDTDGDIPLQGSYIQVHHILEWLAEANFAGHITIMVDACYSGMWAKRVGKYIHKGSREKTETIYQPLRRAAQNSGQKTFINIRASSLSGETSADTSDGGKYTQSVLAGLRREHAWTSQDGRGWGTKVLTERPPDENTCVFGTSRSEPQTDLVCDYVIHPDGKTTVHFPGSRRDYLTSILN